MRILAITNMYPPHHLGGYELLCRDVVDRWRAQAHDVTVLTTTMKLPDVDDRSDSGIRRELDFYYRDHLISRPSMRRRLAIERRNVAALERALSEVQPDVASIWHMGAMSMSLIGTLVERGMPSVFVLGDAWLLYAPIVDAWTSFFERHRPLARPATLLTRVPTTVPEMIPNGASSFASEWLLQQAANRTRLRTVHNTVVPFGINSAEFHPSRGSGNGEKWRWRLLSVGRLDERKGIHIAIRALTHLPRAALHVWGRGDERYLAHLKALAAGLGLSDRVRFGDLPRAALREEYASSDVLLFPTLWDEPFGLVPLEAMACATPVVATATGGSAEFLVDGSNCLVVPKDDETALANAVRTLADDAALRERIIARGLQTAAIFDVDRLAVALERWHVAAAERFEHGPPAPVPSAMEELRAHGVLVDN